MRLALATLAAVLTAGTAHAYPQFIGKSYTNCVTCHYNPSGGGLANSYGHATNEATIAAQSLRDKVAKHDVSGVDDDGKPVLQYDVGLDTRFLFLRTPLEENQDPSFLAIPMLMEAGAVVARGPLMVYGTLTPRRIGAERSSYTVFSREHWAGYKHSDAMMVRTGRMVLPFGIRQADHTIQTREAMGFGKWDQDYGAQLDYNSEKWSIGFAGFAGDLLLTPSRLQRRGAAGSVAYNWPSRASLGASLLVASRGLGVELEDSLFLRLRLVQRAYLMGEIASRYRSGRGDDSQLDGAAFARLGWFATEWLDLFFEWTGRATANHYDLTRMRYQLGANWLLLPWVELSPAAVFEEDVESGMQSTVFLQLHVFY